MKSADYTIVATDVGNSRVKILCDTDSFSFEYVDGWVDEVKNIIRSRGGKRIVVGVSSVEPRRLEDLMKVRNEEPNIVFILLNQLLAKENMPVSLKKVRGMGADRVLGLYGGLRYLSPPFLTVDCGTAITINVLSYDSQCLGGAILPGIGTQLRALHTFTGQLPVVKPASVEAAAGTTTEEAMLVGVVRGAAGAVLHIIRTIEKAHFGGKPVPVFVTGGEAALLLKANADGREFIHREHLVREGIFYCTQQLLESGSISWENNPQSA